ncbi:unnamed protein product [Discosporangium mesarthrocarpum]
MTSTIKTSKFEFNRFAKILSKYNYQVKLFDILAGVIIGLESNYALVDIGLQNVAFLPLEEISIQKIDQPNQILTTNFIGEFLIISINKKTNDIIVSLNQVHYLRLWERLKQMDFRNSIIYGIIEKSIHNGKIINFNGLKFFSVNSHIPKYYRRMNFQNVLLPFKFIEVKDNIHVVHVNSRLAFLKKLSQFLKVNQIYYGCITSIRSFGIFLNIYGIQCLLHISEISNKKITNIKDFYKLGDKIKVKLIYKDVEYSKITVSIKKI